MREPNEHDVIQTRWEARHFGGGMSTVFTLDGKTYAAPGVSDWARKNLTIKEARWLVANGKALETLT